MLAGKACILCGWIPLLQSISVMSGGSAKWCHRSCRHTHWQLSEFTPSTSSVSSSLTNRLHNFGPMWTYLQQFNNAPLRLMWTYLQAPLPPPLSLSHNNHHHQYCSTMSESLITGRLLNRGEVPSLASCPCKSAQHFKTYLDRIYTDTQTS